MKSIPRCRRFLSWITVLKTALCIGPIQICLQFADFYDSFTALLFLLSHYINMEQIQAFRTQANLRPEHKPNKLCLTWKEPPDLIQSTHNSVPACVHRSLSEHPDTQQNIELDEISNLLAYSSACCSGALCTYRSLPSLWFHLMRFDTITFSIGNR